MTLIDGVYFSAAVWAKTGCMKLTNVNDDSNTTTEIIKRNFLLSKDELIMITEICSIKN